ncbi:MAG: FAD binding domain-containing protein [Candidatus Binatia bacterium]
MQAFEYRTPKSLREVHQDLQTFGTDVKLIAGGTALVIMMKQRLVSPACLISLRSLSGLKGIAQKNGGLQIGTLVTHSELETSSLIRRRLPLLAETYHHVATRRVRNMATVGGGLAHADPNQDPPPTLIALGASAKVTSADGSREVPLETFFTDYYETILKPEEILTEIFVPLLPTGSGGAFLKFLPRTADDYATVSAAAVVTLDRAKKNFKDVRIAMGSVGTTPIRAKEAEEVLRGQPVKPEGLREAAEKAKQVVDPVSDFRGSAGYKKEMAGVFVKRALEKALENAGKKTEKRPSTTKRPRAPKRKRR